MPIRRKKRSRLLLALVCLLAALGLGEAMLRVFWPTLGERPLRDEMLGWASKDYLEFAPEPRPSGDERLRVLALGDSFLKPSFYRKKGVDVRFPAVLERSLPDRIITRTLATSGWGTDQELLAYLGKGRPWQLDVVILAFCSNNDLSNILSTSHGRTSRKPYFRIEDDGGLQLYDHEGQQLQIALSQASRELPVRSYVWDYMHMIALSLGSSDESQAEGVDPRYALFDGLTDPRITHLLGLPERLGFAPQVTVSLVNAYVHDPGELTLYQWELCEAVIGELDRQVQADGAKLIVMLLPTPFQPRDLRTVPGGSLVHVFETPEGSFTFRAAEPRDRLSGICDRLGVSFFNPCTEFIARVAAAGNEEQIWPRADNRHYSALGQEYLASSLEEYLRDELGLL